MNNLLPCPMCNGKAEVIKGHAPDTVWPHGDFHRAFCTSCQLRQLFYRTEREAITAWNTRHTPEGWRLVPVEATEEMVEESELIGDHAHGLDFDDASASWDAMLAAAPKWGGE